MHRKAAFLLFSLCFGLPLSLFAQVGTELTVSLVPEHPRPNQDVTVSVESYNIDLNRAEVRWYVNDSTVQIGPGQKRFTLNAGNAGELTVVRIIALTEDGTTYSSTINIRPAEVNLMWQAESYTPPFYKGKALMPFQGTVLVAAIPSFMRGGVPMASESLVYTWMEGDEVIGDSSGKGKSLFVFRGGVPMRTKTISVRVESPDNSMIAESSINVTPVEPRLLFYEEHPRYGFRPKALLNRFTLQGEETRITAIPYYFEAGSMLAKELIYEWELNYGVVEQRGPSITMRRTTPKGGESLVFLSARHSDDNRSFQTAEEKLTVAFPQLSALEEGDTSF